MDQPNQFSTDELNLSITYLPNCEVEFTVLAKKPLIEKAKEKAQKEVTKEISIPGFRKGKAPLDLIEKRFKPAIEEKSKQFLADLSFRKAETLAKTPVLNAETRIIYDLKGEDETGVSMTYRFETQPQVPSVDLNQIHLPPLEKQEATEEQVDETIRSIQSFFSTLDVVKDRPVQEGDYILIDIEDLDKTPPEKVFHKMRFEVSKKGMADWMKELVIGMTPEESKTGISKPNEEDSDEVKAEYQPKNVRVTLHEIQTAHLPEVDENLAKKVGVDSVEEMRSQLKKQIASKVKEEESNKRKDQLSEYLVKTYPFELPKSLVDREFEHRMRRLHQDQNFEKNWKSLSFEQQEEVKNKTLKESTDAITLFYLFRKVMADHSIPIEPPKRSSDPSSLIEAMFRSNQDPEFENASEEERAILLSKAMLNSAQNFILEKIEPSASSKTD